MRPGTSVQELKSGHGPNCHARNLGFGIGDIAPVGYVGCDISDRGADIQQAKRCRFLLFLHQILPTPVPPLLSVPSLAILHGMPHGGTVLLPTKPHSFQHEFTPFRPLPPRSSIVPGTTFPQHLQRITRPSVRLLWVYLERVLFVVVFLCVHLYFS